jgi:molybdopterin synthase sulfur carrier subunit
MIKILYFANLREKLGSSGESLELPAGVDSVGDVLITLAARGGEWASLATVKNLKSAVNQEMARADSPVKDGDEVAFFPPVTGG